MAYFARKVRYGAHDGDAGASYMALVEIAKKKGGRSVGFVLYRRVVSYFHPSDSEIKMIRLQAANVEEAIKRFWPLDEGSGEEFPGHQSHRWEKTTLWLDYVAAGGGYERFGYNSENGKVQFGDWVRVGMPVPWRSRRRKKQLQFGNPAHIVLVRQAIARGLEEEKTRLEMSLSGLERYDNEGDCGYVPEENEIAYDAVCREIARIEEEIDSISVQVRCAKEEMRFKVRRMFPNPAGKTLKRIMRASQTPRSSAFG